MTLTDAERRELEIFFLSSVQERIALDIAAVESGGIPRKWEGDAPLPPDALERLRQFHANASRAIEHVRTGGSLDETPTILWDCDKEATPPS